MMGVARSETELFPDTVVIVGGGRWARVLAEVLCGLVPQSVTISVYSRHNSEAMLAWVRARGLEKRITLCAEWHPSLSSRPWAAIVANAARDHLGAVEKALLAGVPVLVEKPIALRSDAAHHLAMLARRRGVRLAPAHVFLYASYLKEFSQHVEAAGCIKSLYVEWGDPVQEERYGERKRYDAGLPVFADWLPHVIPILGVVLGTLPDEFRGLNVKNGGAGLELNVAAGRIACQIVLERNARRRRRIIRALVDTQVFELDFSSEPGTIKYGGAIISADPDWESRKRPVESMLSAFLKWAAGGERDPRLDIDAGLRACEIIDQTADKYYAVLLPWIYSKLVADEPVDENLRYALTELISANGPVCSKELDDVIASVKALFVGHGSLDRIKELECSCDPARWLRILADLREARRS